MGGIKTKNMYKQVLGSLAFLGGSMAAIGFYCRNISSASTIWLNYSDDEVPAPFTSSRLHNLPRLIELAGRTSFLPLADRVGNTQLMMYKKLSFFPIIVKLKNQLSVLVSNSLLAVGRELEPECCFGYLQQSIHYKQTGDKAKADELLAKARQVEEVSPSPLAYLLPTKEEWDEPQTPTFQLQNLVEEKIWLVKGKYCLPNSHFRTEHISVVFRFENGELLVVNPTNIDEETANKIAALGTVKYIAASTPFHNLYVKKFHSFFPEAETIGLEEQKQQEGNLWQKFITKDCKMKDELEILQLEGTNLADSLYFHPDSGVLWGLTDAALCVRPDLEWSYRMYYTSVGAMFEPSDKPVLQSPQNYHILMTRYPSTVNLKLSILLEKDIKTLVCHHGGVISDNPKEELERVFAFVKEYEKDGFLASNSRLIKFILRRDLILPWLRYFFNRAYTRVFSSSTDKPKE